MPTAAAAPAPFCSAAATGQSRSLKRQSRNNATCIIRLQQHHYSVHQFNTEHGKLAKVRSAGVHRLAELAAGEETIWFDTE